MSRSRSIALLSSMIVAVSFAAIAIVSGERTVSPSPTDQPEMRIPQAIADDLKGRFLRVEAPNIDLGRVDPGTLVHHQFVIYNDSDETVRIEVTESSCNCTTAELSLLEIPPGGIAELRVEMDTKLVRGPSMVSVDLATSDPDLQGFSVSIRCNVTEAFHVVPQRLHFGKVCPGDDLEFKVRVISGSTQIMSVPTVRWDEEWLDVSVEEVTRKMGEREATVRIKVPSSVGHYQSRIVFSLDGEEKSPEFLVLFESNCGGSKDE